MQLMQYDPVKSQKSKQGCTHYFDYGDPLEKSYIR
jgi:hypothetical protein